jgi:hypothetical protein
MSLSPNANPSPNEVDARERVLVDAEACEATLFAREDYFRMIHRGQAHLQHL